jgi:hypothetical protein
MVVTGSLDPAAVAAGSPDPASVLCGAGASEIRLKLETRGACAEIVLAGSEETAEVIEDGVADDVEGGGDAGEVAGLTVAARLALTAGEPAPGSPVIASPVPAPGVEAVGFEDAAGRPPLPGTVAPLAATGDGDVPLPTGGLTSTCAASIGLSVAPADGADAAGVTG